MKQDKEIIIDGLRELADQETQDGLVDGVSQELIRDTLALLTESRPERILLRLTNWVKLTPETFEKLKNTVMAQLENGDKVIIIPNVCEAVYIPDGLEVKFLP